MKRKNNKWKYLDSYVENFKKNDGLPEEPNKLPDLVIYFRFAFDKLGLSDYDVPDFLKWCKYRTDDFLSWGHNSRWANTFCYMLYENTDKYVKKLKKAMEEYDIEDFDLLKELKR